MNKLFDISSRVGIGRAKTAPADSYQDQYRQLAQQMEDEILQLAEKGGEVL